MVDKKAAQDQIKEFEDELAKTPYNKRTQHHIGLVKAKIAGLRKKQEARISKKGTGHGYSVRKGGDGTAILVGYPSVGKSTLLNAITGANSEVGAYEFTTLDVVPGALNFKHAQIQVLDVPGIVSGAASGRGRGREVLAVSRSSDLVIILLDATHPEHQKSILKEIFDSGIRINARRPDVTIKKTAKDGIRIGTTVRLTKVDRRTIADVLREFKLNNADVVIRDDISIDELIDCIEDNKKYVPALTVLNKCDLLNEDELKKVIRSTKADIALSATKADHIEELKNLIFDKLDFMRIFCKEVGKKADMEVPLILTTDATIRTMCDKLHKDFVSKFKFAKVWGPSAKFDGQKFLLGHKLKDEDIVELHIL